MEKSWVSEYFFNEIKRNKENKKIYGTRSINSETCSI